MDKLKHVEIQGYQKNHAISNLTLYEHLIIEIAKSLAKNKRVTTDWIATDTVMIVNKIFELTEGR